MQIIIYHYYYRYRHTFANKMSSKTTYISLITSHKSQVASRKSQVTISCGMWCALALLFSVWILFCRNRHWVYCCLAYLSVSAKAVVLLDEKKKKKTTSLSMVICCLNNKCVWLHDTDDAVPPQAQSYIQIFSLSKQKPNLTARE